MLNRRALLQSGAGLVGASAWPASRAGSFDDFFIAIKRDDPRTIVRLVRRGFDPNTRNPQGETGLTMAFKEASLKAVEALLAAPGIQVNALNSAGESPLMLAALKGQTEWATRLLQMDADVNKTGWAPLHYAATGGHLALVRQLLDKHAYIDAESPNGTTPLMMAAGYGSLATVRLLLEEGADPSLKNQLGLSAQDFAARANREDVTEAVAAAVRRRGPQGRW